MNNDFLTDINCLGDLFTTVCVFKHFIVKLQSEELATFKHNFYSLKFSKWQLNLLWELIWNDRTIHEVAHVFITKKLLKEGDIIENLIRQAEKTDSC